MLGADDGRMRLRDGASTVLAARRRSGLSQEQLAERTGLSVRSISNLERGVVDRPRRASLAAIAAALELDAAERAALTDSYDRAWGRRAGYPVCVDPEPVPAAPPARGAVPAQLLADNPVFVGRDAQLARLDDLLPASESSVGIALLHGAPGVGKSTLAMHWAHAVRHRFPDGQLYANLSGYGTAAPADPAVVLMNFLLALGVESAAIPAGQQARSAMFRSLLAGRRMIVILDDARDPAQLRPLLPGQPGVVVVVTTRSRMRGLSTSHQALRVGVDPLTAAEGTALLIRLTGASRAAAEPGAVVAILDCCGGIPLALTLVAERICERADRPLATFADELVDVRTRLDRLAAADDETARVRSVMSWSYDALSPLSARVFRMLAAHPGSSFGAESAAAMLSMPVDLVSPVLDQLVGVHLLEQGTHGRFAYHQLMRLYAAERAAHVDPDAERVAALDRVRQFFLTCGVTAAGSPGSAGGGRGFPPDLLTESPDGVLHAGPWRVPPDVRLRLGVWRVHPLTAARPGPPAGGALHEAHSAHELGVLLRGIGIHHDAGRCFARAARTFADAGEPRLRAVASGEHGLTKLCTGELAEAAELLGEAGRAAAQAGDVEREGYALASTGNVHRLLGQDAAARRCLARAALIARSAHLPTLALIVDGYAGELGPPPRTVATPCRTPAP